MNPRKILKITEILVKSQLRSGRSGRRFIARPTIVLILDFVIFAAGAVLVSFVLGAMGPLTSDIAHLLDTLTLQAITSLPALIAPFVFIAAVLFELSVSSKFASSDVVNWLPVSQTDYVTASTISVSYMYSWLPALVLGVTYPLAARLGLQSAWGVAGVLSLVTLFAMGALVEIMRAAINRVSSMVYGKARRGTLVIRLVVTVGVILAVELAFQPVIIAGLVTSFTGVVNAAFFVPFFWPSVSISYLIAGQLLPSIAFFGLTLGFALLVLFAAVKVRSRYWSPLPVTIEVSRTVYAPRSGFLQSLGLSAIEAAIVRKDLKGYTRRRELIQLLALPAVFVALFVFQAVSSNSFGSTNGITYYPYWLMGGLMAVIVASGAVGQEGKAILTIYASPVTARAFLKAKLLVASLFGWMTGLALVVATAVFGSVSLWGFLASLVVSLLIALECTLLGFGVAARYPDLVERPRPRFVRPLGLLIAVVTGIALAVVTAFPLLLWPLMRGYFEGLGVSYGVAVGAGLAFGAVVSVLAYRWASSGASELLTEIPI